MINVSQVNRQWREVTKASSIFSEIEAFDAMSNGGMCYGWGFDYHGQLAKMGANKPTFISAFGSNVNFWNSNKKNLKFILKVNKIHAGEQTSFVMKKSGLYSLGMNDHGRLGVEGHPYEAEEFKYLGN